jgi:hypothetical protein
MGNWHTVQVSGWVVRSSTHSEEHSFDEDKFELACECLEELRDKYPDGEFSLCAEIDA